MSESAYTRIALRLRTVGAADREWLLSRLDADDCRQVSAALQAHRRSAERPATAHVAAAPSAADNSPLTRLRAASAAEIEGLLSAQPDWVTAVVLSAPEEWPWAPQYLAGLSPDRIRSLRSLTTDCSRAVKQKAREALLQILADKLIPAPVHTPATSAFDTALERASSGMSPLDHWRLTSRD
jgi:hypothetical protein